MMYGSHIGRIGRHISPHSPIPLTLSARTLRDGNTDTPGSLSRLWRISPDTEYTFTIAIVPIGACAIVTIPTELSPFAIPSGDITRHMESSPEQFAYGPTRNWGGFVSSHNKPSPIVAAHNKPPLIVVCHNKCRSRRVTTGKTDISDQNGHSGQTRTKRGKSGKTDKSRKSDGPCGARAAPLTIEVKVTIITISPKIVMLSATTNYVASHNK